MNALTELIRNDMKPALGVTEPGAIAFAVSTAVKHTSGNVRKVKLALNSGMFKNAFTCGIPGSAEVGNYHAAALGASGADPDKGLECLEGITQEQADNARRMVNVIFERQAAHAKPALRDTRPAREHPRTPPNAPRWPLQYALGKSKIKTYVNSAIRNSQKRYFQ